MLRRFSVAGVSEANLATLLKNAQLSEADNKAIRNLAELGVTVVSKDGAVSHAMFCSGFWLDSRQCNAY